MTSLSRDQKWEKIVSTLQHIQYLKIHPKPKFTLPNGFTIFESFFKNPDGSRGIVAGPHRYITEILQSLNQSHMSLGAYLTDMANAFRDLLSGIDKMLEQKDCITKLKSYLWFLIAQG